MLTFAENIKFMLLAVASVWLVILVVMVFFIAPMVLVSWLVVG